LARLEEALRPVPEAAPPDLLSSILARARADDTAARSRGVRQSVIDGVRPYLGARATDRLTGAPAAGHNLLATLEPVLALFLGRRAAGRLVTHVVDNGIVRA